MLNTTADGLLNHIAAAIAALPASEPRLVAIDGRSAAGKTTLADALATHLRQTGHYVLRSSIDAFHPPGHKYRSRERRYTPQTYYDEGFDYAAFRAYVLEPLRSNGTRRCRLALWDSFHDVLFPEQWTDARQDTLLIVDGAFLLRPELYSFWDYHIWLDIDWDTMIERAVNRDVAWVGDADMVREHYRTFWIPTHHHYERDRNPMEWAHLVVDNRDPQHPRLIHNRMT